MIRDPETLAALQISIARFVRERLIPNETIVAETDAIPESINGIGSQGIVLDGTPAQKARYLPQLASGELIASFAPRYTSSHSLRTA